eukprot:5921326-Pyramimonas_sp.AAC.1
MDNTGQMQGHLQSTYGAMHDWSTRLPRCIDAESAEIMANHRLLFAPFERERCAGHHQHVSVRNKELFMGAQYTLNMRSRIVEAVQIAH